MQFIEDVNHDIHVAQNAWDEAVEHWQQSVIGLLSSTEEKHKALSRLTTETNKLIHHLNLFTEDYRLTVTSLLQERTSVHSSSSARNIAQNAEAVRTLIIHSSRFQEELLEDLPLRRALIRKLETVYTKRISAPKGNFLKEDLLQAFLLAGRCRDVLKAVDSSFERSGIVVRPSTHSASMCDQVSEASALSRTSRYQLVTDIPQLGLCLRKYDRKDQDRFQRRSSRDEDISAYLSSFQSGGHPTLDDMQSMFTNIKRRSLAMVFNVIEQFREDEQRISMEIKGTNDKLQAHQESHQEQLDVLKDCTENMIERLDLKLNDFKEEFNKSTAHGHMQYGQGNTTEYIGNLWTIALRFLPIHGTEDVGKIQRSVTDELQRLGDRVVAECFAVEDLRIHSSFMTSIYNSTTQSDDSKSNSSSKNISTLLNQDLETIAETPECETEVEIDCSIPDSEDSPSNSLAGELAHLDLVHTAFCDLELEAKTTLSQSEGDDAAGRDLQDRRSHFSTGPSDTSSSWISFNSYSLSRSVSFALAITDLVQSCSSALVSLKLRAKWPMPTLPVLEYSWDGLQLSSIIRISGTVRFWIASKLNASLGQLAASLIFVTSKLTRPHDSLLGFPIAFIRPSFSAASSTVITNHFPIPSHLRQYFPKWRRIKVVLVHSGWHRLSHPFSYCSALVVTTENRSSVFMRFIEVFLLNLPTVLFLLIGIAFLLQLKATVDRKILEVSHNYLPFDFRRMLRHDEERRQIV